MTPTRRRSVPAVVWALVAVHGLLLVSWAVVVPAYRAPDEPQHLDMAFALRADGRWPEPGERRVTQRIRRSQHHFPLRGFDGTLPDSWPLTAEAAPPRSARPTYAEVAPDAPSDQHNQQWQHPPLYYGAVAAVLAAAPGTDGWGFDRVLLLARLTSAAMILPLPLLAWAAARASQLPEAVAVTAAAVPLAIPQLTHIGASVNNDNLLVLFASAATAVAAAVLAGDLRRRTAVVFGAVGAGALLSKGFGLYLPAFIAAAYAVAWWRHRSSEAVRHGALAVGVCAALGGWWWVANVVRHGALQPSGARFAPPPEEFAPDAGAWAAAFVPTMVERFWGVFGLLQAPLPRLVVAAASALLVGCLLAAFLRRPVGADRTHLGVLLLPLAATAAIAAYGSWQYYVESATFPGMQGRYLFPGIVGVAVAAAAGVRRPAAVLAVALAMQVAGLVTTMRHFWGPPGARDLGESFRAAMAWAPVPPAATVVAVVGALGLGGLLVVRLVRADVTA